MQLSHVFYASPSKQSDYIQKVLGIDFDERLRELAEKWVEYKASKDLVVHNAGICNEKYILKVGSRAVWNLDEPVVIDGSYLNTFIAESKSYIGKICTAVQQKNKS